MPAAWSTPSTACNFPKVPARPGAKPWPLAALLTFAIIVAFFRYVSLASIVAAVFAPAYYLLVDGVAWQASGAKTLAMVAMGLLLIWRHRENIQRLLAGTESKLGARKK